MPGGGGGSVSPGACGDIAKVDLGRRIHAFLEASATLERSVLKIEGNVKGACVTMGKKLGMESDALKGETKGVCQSVAANLKSSLRAGLKGSAKLEIKYKPAVCEVKADVAAKAAAKCEGKASADLQASCSGTCNGKCDGTCSGSTGSGGECNGQCSGTCEGSCSGNAEVKAEATCKASAEVKANAEVKCSKPELDISYDASLVADTKQLEGAIAAIKAGGPALLQAKAQVTGPVKVAARAYARTAKRLAAGGSAKLKSLGSQAICVSGQLAAAAKASANINASVSVSVSASASASGSAGM